MNIPVNIIVYHNVIDHVVAIQVEVVYHCTLVIQIPFEIFESFSFLEEFHNCIEIEVITWQTQIFIRIVLCPGYAPACYQQRDD